MTAVDRAAEVIVHRFEAFRRVDPQAIAEALDAAGLLVTDEAKAVLDAVIARRAALDSPPPLVYQDDSPEMIAWTKLLAETTADQWNAVDAYLASRQVTT